MRAKDFIVEYAISKFKPAPNLLVVVDSHYMERRIERGLSHHSTGLIVGQMPQIIDQLQTVPVGDEVWLYNDRIQVALGMRRNLDKKGVMEFMLMTAIDASEKPPHPEGATPIIMV